MPQKEHLNDVLIHIFLIGSVLNSSPYFFTIIPLFRIVSSIHLFYSLYNNNIQDVSFFMPSYILGISILFDAKLEKIISHSVGCLFTQQIIFFTWQLFYFHMISFAKYCQYFFLLLEFYSESPCLCLSVKEFNVYLHLTMSRFISYIISFIHFHLCFSRVSDIILALFLCTLSAQCPYLMCSVPRTVY